MTNDEIFFNVVILVKLYQFNVLGTKCSLVVVLILRSRWTQPILQVPQKFDPTRPDPTHGWTRPVSISAMRRVGLYGV